MRKSVNTLCANSRDEYLLQMRDGTSGICDPLRWSFFGGKMEENENPIVAAQRELNEEIGIAGSEEDFLLLGDMNYDDGIVFFVRYKPNVEWKDIDVREGAGAGFFTKEEISALNVTDQAKLLVEHFL